MKRFLAALALVASLFTASHAENPPHNLRTFATEAGLPSDFEIQYEVGDFQAYFTNGGMACFLFTCWDVPPHIYVSAPAEWPREWVLATLYHEIGHYHQYREGVPRYEWDADLRAALQLCSMGLNGPEIMAEMLAHVTPLVKIESPRHGNHYRRIDNMRGRGCNGRGLDVFQSP